MGQPSRQTYEFGPFRVDAIKRLLLRDDQPVPLKPKAFEILLALVENNGRVIEKDELMSKVWANTVVEESNLAHHISALRKALGDDHREHRYIVTISGRGYSFVADVRQPQSESIDLVVAKHSRSQIVIEHEEMNEEDPARQIVPSSESVYLSPTPSSSLRAGRTPAAPGQIVEDFFTKIKSHRRSAGLILALLAVAATSVVSILSRPSGRNESERTASVASRKIQITKLTNTGNAASATMSPDGEYIAYVSRDVDGKSIWLKHLGTGSVQQILPTVRVRNLAGLTFSRDGGFIYFNKSEGFGPLEELYRMPVLGGVPTKLITDLTWRASLSPDGTKLAFVRNSQTTDESTLMIANEDGSAEYKLAARKLSDGYVSIAWSPNGKVIVCSAGGSEVSGERMYLVEVGVADGAERVLTSQRWVFLGSILWLADGSGFFASGYSQGTIAGIWHIAYPGGEARKLTNDANVISAADLAADSRIMVGQTLALHTTIWTVPIGNEVASPAALAKQVTTGTSNYKVYGWMPDGRILFTAAASNPLGECIWVMNADGTRQKQLTANAEGNAMPVCSPDGRYIVFESNRAGRLNIWRMDSDGGNPRQLTFGDNEKSPACSPDGEWVVYTSGDDSRLWKVPMAGGEPAKLTESHWRSASFSPDGKWLASLYRDQQPNSQYRIGILPFGSGTPIKMFAPPPDVSFTPVVRWTRDGQALIYACTRDGVTNLWRQPLRGDKPKQLTDFKANDEIYGFNLSPDGKQIVFARGGWTFDIVLIRDFL